MKPLTKCRDEVFQMILTEYDEKLHLKNTREEGLEEGLEVGLQRGQNRVNTLNLKLIELNRTEDIIKAAQDKSYQEQLFKEFNL